MGSNPLRGDHSTRFYPDSIEHFVLIFTQLYSLLQYVLNALKIEVQHNKTFSLLNSFFFSGEKGEGKVHYFKLSEWEGG